MVVRIWHFFPVIGISDTKDKGVEKYIGRFTPKNKNTIAPNLNPFAEKEVRYEITLKIESSDVDGANGERSCVSRGNCVGEDGHVVSLSDSTVELLS